jgi:putative adhesin
MIAAPTATFDSPEAISIDLDIEYGGVRIIAADRKTTVVDVRPASEGRRADLDAAERTRVHFADGRLEVRAPKPRGLSRFIRPGGIEVVMQVPSGSHVRGNTAYLDFDAEGRLGDCFIKTSYGTLRVEETGALTLQASAGNITAGRSTGPAEISSSSGDLRLGEAIGPANLKTSSGDIRVERADNSISARTAYGAIHVAHAVRGELDLTTSYGDIEVGVVEGTATFLELRSDHGRVRNELDRVDDAREPGEFLKVRARVGYGDIWIRRS